MAAIQSLLNPVTEHKSMSSPRDDEQASETGTSIGSPPDTRGLPARKKQKICKDAAVFKPGPVRGECRYPPHEVQNELLAAQHQMFEVYPMGDIAKFPRHIPYNSEKKMFLERTGRDSLEVFQYQFKCPKSDTIYTMLWDYNIGLVRTTPLFKCGGYSKTTPAKMLARNVGLKDICHSITGGALVAQGYWIPYEAAKAIAATFCWNIRYALTPVFGTDFPGLCLPEDSPEFGQMKIDRSITKKCALEAQVYREMEKLKTPSPYPSPTASTLSTPKTPVLSRTAKKLRAAPQMVDSASDSGTESSYTRTDEHEMPGTSPQITRSVAWTPVNPLRSSPHRITFRDPWARDRSYHSRTPEPAPRRFGDIPRSHAVFDTKPPPLRPRPNQAHLQYRTLRKPLAWREREVSSSEISPKSTTVPLDSEYDASSDESVKNQVRKTSRIGKVEAAHILVQMKMCPATLPPVGELERKRRATQ